MQLKSFIEVSPTIMPESIPGFTSPAGIVDLFQIHIQGQNTVKQRHWEQGTSNWEFATLQQETSIRITVTHARICQEKNETNGSKYTE